MGDKARFKGIQPSPYLPPRYLFGQKEQTIHKSLTSIFTYFLTFITKHKGKQSGQL